MVTTQADKPAARVKRLHLVVGPHRQAAMFVSCQPHSGNCHNEGCRRVTSVRLVLAVGC